jgi:NAD(P)-dependent dehydrogenase (short-subunit alcohol dehydrogenase family)
MNDALPADDAGLDGRVAIVAGGGAADDGIGNGRGSALLLARAGTQVMVVDRDLDAAQRTVEMIAAEGGSAEAHAADLTQEAACEAMVKATVDRFGRLDFLDNNIGISRRNTVVTEDVAGWRQVMEVNVEVMFLTSKYAIPAMIEGGDGGAIVNISSISALIPRGLTAYSVSKGAVIALTKAMAVDHAADRIRVNCISPGPVYTPMVYAPGMTDEQRAARTDATLLKVEGTGWDIGRAARFLLSDEARYITGQNLVVDGGATLVSPPRGAGGK